MDDWLTWPRIGGVLLVLVVAIAAPLVLTGAVAQNLAIDQHIQAGQKAEGVFAAIRLL